MKSVGPLMPPLDDAPGPANSVSQRELRRARQEVLEGVARRARRGAGLAAWLRPAPIGALLAVTLAVGSGAAAVRLWPVLRGAVTAAPSAEGAVERSRAPRRPSVRPAPSAAVAPDPEVPASASQQAPRVTATRAPTDLLARANELRAQKRWGAAEAIYLRVLERGAGPRMNSTAALAAAELRLSKLRQPRAALQLFERALREEPVGPLAEQARHGVARSFRALGDLRREVRALQAFIAAHPESLMVPHARRRLRIIDTAR